MKKKCQKLNHSPGILSMSHDFYVCDYCDEVFDWTLKGFDYPVVSSVTELGHWPGDERLMEEQRKYLESRDGK